MAHSHDAAPTVQIDDPEPSSTWVVSIGGTIVFIALVLFLCVLYFAFAGRLEDKTVIDVPVTAVVEARTSQKALLAQYERYAQTLPDGKTVERIRIPVDRAMELVAAELASRPAGAAAGAKP